METTLDIPKYSSERGGGKKRNSSALSWPY